MYLRAPVLDPCYFLSIRSNIFDIIAKNKLKLNGAKSEFMLMETKVQLRKVNIDGLIIGNSKIEPNANAVGNLDTWFDCNFTWTHTLQ